MSMAQYASILLRKCDRLHILFFITVLLGVVVGFGFREVKVLDNKHIGPFKITSEGVEHAKPLSFLHKEGVNFSLFFSETGLDTPLFFSEKPTPLPFESKKIDIKALSPSPKIISPEIEMVNTCEPRLLQHPCSSNVPQFVTFGFTHVGRWAQKTLIEGLTLMYSSLVRSHKCMINLHVYSDNVALIMVLKDLRTTMGTKTNITTHFLSPASIGENGYSSPWIRLSRHKLNIMSKHVRHGTRVVWIDVDTLVFTDLTKAFEGSSTWVVGWHTGNKNLGKDYRTSGVAIPPRFQAQGDLWSVDSDAIEEILVLEKTLKVKPEYDLQGYFSILLARGSSRFHLLTDVMANFTFGFQCSNGEHPNKSNFDPRVVDNELHCLDKQNTGLSTRVGSISFTAPTFSKLFLSGDISKMSNIANEEVRDWLIMFFYCS